MESIQDKEKYLDDLLDTDNNVIGEIYMIINLINMKVYIGQTVSHRKNRNKYRPFGYIKRMKEHISEANYQNKQHESCFLNNAIRKYGDDNFSVELLLRCSLNETDQYEQHYINLYGSLYPHGYNLTIGGKGQFAVVLINSDDIDEKIKKEKVQYKHSDDTKKKISMRLTHAKSTVQSRQQLSDNTQIQHDKNKIAKFAHVKIDHNNLDQYIYPITHGRTGKVYFKIKINGLTTAFTSKHASTEQLKERILKFLKQLPSI